MFWRQAIEEKSAGRIAGWSLGADLTNCRSRGTFCFRRQFNLETDQLAGGGEKSV